MDERTRKLAQLNAHNEQCMTEHLHAIQCGARTRAGTPCKRTDIHANGRCKYHGGMSTGARTEEGKERQREGYRRWLEKKHRADTGTQ